MKSVGAASGGSGEGSKTKNRERMKKKNEKRIGGKGLSLEAFANAKSRTNGYNPSLIKKQREYYKNAKYLGKYKKSVKLENQPRDLPAELSLEDVDGNENEAKPSKKNKNKKKTSLQSVREDFEKRQAEQLKAKLEREAAIQAKKEERAKAEAKRKVSRGNMFKKTRSGQPVMKYRIEHLLEGILQEGAS